jgi:RasGEF domain/RasGEF N-terminal motif
MADEYDFQTCTSYFLSALQNPLNGLRTRKKTVRLKKFKDAFDGNSAAQCVEDLGVPSRTTATIVLTHLLEAGFIQVISGRQSSHEFYDDPNTYYIFTHYPAQPARYASKNPMKAAEALANTPTRLQLTESGQLAEDSEQQSAAASSSSSSSSSVVDVGGSLSSNDSSSSSSSLSPMSALRASITMPAIGSRSIRLSMQGNSAIDAGAMGLGVPGSDSFGDDMPDDQDDIKFEVDSNGQAVVKGASVERLVERLTHEKWGDVVFRNAFLLTYRSFIGGVELVNRLAERFSVSPPMGVSREDLEDFDKNYRKPIQLRVYSVLRTWLSRYPQDFVEDRALADRLRAMATDTLAPATAFWAQNAETMIGLLDKKLRREQSRQVALRKTTPILPEGGLEVGSFGFDDVEVLEIARQLTVMEHRQYRKILAKECLGQGWNGAERKERAPNISGMIDGFNQVSGWVTDRIVSSAALSERVATLRKMIELAEHLRALNNFNGIMEVLAGINNSAVRRLKKTWAELPKATLDVFARIEALMSHQGNFCDYREKLHSIKPPCVPYIGVYLTDLTFIEDGYPDFTHNGELINFKKRLKLASVIEELQQYQKDDYTVTITEVSAIQHWIGFLEGVPDDQAYQHSMKVEPRNTEEAIENMLKNERRLEDQVMALEMRIAALEAENVELRSQNKAYGRRLRRTNNGGNGASGSTRRLKKVSKARSVHQTSSASASDRPIVSPRRSKQSLSSKLRINSKELVDEQKDQVLGSDSLADDAAPAATVTSSSPPPPVGNDDSVAPTTSEEPIAPIGSPSEDAARKRQTLLKPGIAPPPRPNRRAVSMTVDAAAEQQGDAAAAESTKPEVVRSTSTSALPRGAIESPPLPATFILTRSAPRHVLRAGDKPERLVRPRLSYDYDDGDDDGEQPEGDKEKEQEAVAEDEDALLRRLSVAAPPTFLNNAESARRRRTFARGAPNRGGRGALPRGMRGRGRGMMRGGARDGRGVGARGRGQAALAAMQTFDMPSSSQTQAE